MPEKLHVKLGPTAGDNAISIKFDDGTMHRLDKVLSITLNANADERIPPTVTLTMLSPDFESDIPISDDLAQAILRCSSDRQLSFIDDTEAAALRELYKRLGGIYAGLSSRAEPLERAGFDVLTKIMAELARRGPNPGEVYTDPPPAIPQEPM
jgi:hypothetical protein